MSTSTMVYFTVYQDCWKTTKRIHPNFKGNIVDGSLKQVKEARRFPKEHTVYI